ncbi:MAG: 3'(2'),5'-bisphosphate nucleotidase [Saprospirales bacterium]|nr:MAG: 3'(2'),5'-bisphosphate nucleotidase [Saprospirales bacterium]
MRELVNEKLVIEVLKVASEAMQQIASIYNHSENVAVSQKADGSPVTAADHISNEIIARGLKNIDPALPIISEEGPTVPWEDRKNYDLLWMVDPIDGTYGFINRTGDFSINIALIAEQMPVLGVVATPVNQRLYYAYSGGGAYVNNRGKVRKLSASLFSRQDRELNFICSPTQKIDEIDHYFQKFEKPKIQFRGGTIKFLLLADGKAHIYPCNKIINEWDTAAGQVILEESGGLVLRADNDQPLKYNKTELKNPPFIAYGDIQDL